MTKYKLNQDLRTPSQVTLTSYMVGEGQTDPIGPTCDGQNDNRIIENNLQNSKDDLKSRLECRGCSAKSKYMLYDHYEEKVANFFPQLQS